MSATTWKDGWNPRDRWKMVAADGNTLWEWYLYAKIWWSKIKSYTGDDVMKEIKFVTGGWTDYFPLAGGIILIVGGLFVYYRKKRRKMWRKTKMKRLIKKL